MGIHLSLHVGHELVAATLHHSHERHDGDVGSDT
jgi:hypothetical protein